MTNKKKTLMFSIGVEEETCEFQNETAKINNGARSLVTKIVLCYQIKQVSDIHLNARIRLTDLPTIPLSAEFLSLDCTSCHYSAHSKNIPLKKKKKKKKERRKGLRAPRGTSIVVHWVCRSCQTWRCDFVTEVLEGCRTMRSGRPS